MSVDDKNTRYGRISGLINVAALKAKRLTSVGLGSMGCPVTAQLARHGVGRSPPGRIRLIDGDVVEERNLIGTDYLPRHVGSPKVNVMAEILHEIDGDDERTITLRNQMISESDMPHIVGHAQQSDLMGLFADDFEIMLAVADECYSICPLVMASFGPECQYAEVAFSVPGMTPRLSETLGRRRRDTIHKAEALGCDTAFVANFVASVCLRLMLGNQGGQTIAPCYRNAPLFVIGLQHTWLFEQQPKDLIRSIYCVGTTGHLQPLQGAKP